MIITVLDRYLLGPLTAVLAISFYVLNLIFIPIAVILSGFLHWLIPFKTCKAATRLWLQTLPVAWMSVNAWIMHLSTHGKWDIQGPSLDPNAWYLLISNHQSWADILALGYVFNRKIPLLKFFLKQELLWSLPIAGLACKAAGYPFMKRHTRQALRKNPDLKSTDLATTHQACEKFKEHPCTIMNFVEGTRFSEEKRERQHSPYQHLLKPKSGGLAIVLSEMNPVLKGIVNVTIHYSNPEFSFLDFVCGRVSKIKVRYELLPVTPELIGNYTEDRAFRARFQVWLNTVWQNKDQLLDELKQQPPCS